MKIKKVFLILLIIILTGCTNLNDLTYDDILNNSIVENKNPNTYRNGYQFYLPKGLSVTEGSNSYVVISSNKYNYYLYVDLISFNNKKAFNYELNAKSRYSKEINYNGHKGYVEINLWENNKYLIEIMYNYAKIEVMVDEDALKEVLVNSCLILGSVRYNDIIINNLLTDDNLNYTEEIFDIFKNNNSNGENDLNYQ